MIDLEVLDGVARLALGNPPVNAFAPTLVGAFHDAIDELERRDDWQVLVVGSALKVFSAGGELDTMWGWMQGPEGGRRVGSYSFDVQRLFDRIESLPQVTLAACNGAAVGGGLELALACDLRIASSRARFGLPEVGLNLLPAAGGTQRLARLCGPGAAARMMFTAELLDAAQAEKFGLVQWVFPAEEFEARCSEVTARIGALPKQALTLAKECMALAVPHRGKEGFVREIEAATELGGSDCTRQRVGAFLEGARGRAKLHATPQPNESQALS